MTNTKNRTVSKGERILSRTSAKKKMSIELSMVIASKIESLMTAKSWSEKEFAQKVDYPSNVVENWLGGLHVFSTDELAAIATTLGCKPHQLFS